MFDLPYGSIDKNRSLALTMHANSGRLGLGNVNRHSDRDTVSQRTLGNGGHNGAAGSSGRRPLFRSNKYHN